jgi:uncharacterized membrane protein
MQASKAPAPLRHVLVRLRLVSAIALGTVTYFAASESLGRATRFLIGWNIAIIVFLALVGLMFARSTHDSMRKRAEALDEGRHAVLLLAMLAALGSLVAIVVELYKLKSAPAGVAGLHVGLAIATIVTSWSFVHVIFAEHYAHGFYSTRGVKTAGNDEDAGRRGLRFPGEGRPDYLDFLYFSFTIGVANQTADTDILSREMRALVLVHSVISYFFNTIILALTINIAASMLGG